MDVLKLLIECDDSCTSLPPTKWWKRKEEREAIAPLVLNVASVVPLVKRRRRGSRKRSGSGSGSGSGRGTSQGGREDDDQEASAALRCSSTTTSSSSQGKGYRDDSASLLPLSLLLLTDGALASLLGVPVYALISESGVFDEWSCRAYGAADCALSLFEIALATAIAFDRYIATKQPKWGTWRSNVNYVKLLTILFVLCLLWSLVPWLGYGAYSTFHGEMFCSLDWRQAEPSLIAASKHGISVRQLSGGSDTDITGEAWRDSTHRYIAFLTATFLMFFLIPVCIAGAFYYAVVEHVDKLNSADAREENGNVPATPCTWAPKNHVAKVGLGCLLASTLPFMGYSIVCLNPFKSDFRQLHVVATPAILARIAPLLNPIFYVWLNPDLVGIEEKLLAKLGKKRTPPSTHAAYSAVSSALSAGGKKPYQTINLIAEVSGMSFPILTPSVQRRQLPQIPPHLLSPRPSPTATPTPVTHHYTPFQLGLPQGYAV